MASKRRSSPKKSGAHKIHDLNAIWGSERFRHFPPEVVAYLKEKKYIPLTGEVFYEEAWRQRTGIAKKAIAEGRRNLSRALAIFEHYDDLLTIKHNWFEVKDSTSGKVLVNVFTGKFESSLDDPKPAPRPEQILAATKQILVNGKTAESPGAENQHDLIIEWLKEISCQGYDAVAELGCGYGRNLFHLYCRGGPAGIPYFAGEYTRSGRALTALFAAIDRHAPVKPVFFDHGDPDLSFLKGAKRVLLFSCHSIEQVGRLPEEYFEKLARAAPSVTGLHFEPFGFQLGGSDKISVGHRAAIESKGWNQNMVECLKKAEGKGLLSIRHLAANVVAPQMGNPTSIVLWDNSPLHHRP